MHSQEVPRLHRGGHHIAGTAMVCTEGQVQLHRHSPTVRSALLVRNGPVPFATCSTLLGKGWQAERMMPVRTAQTSALSVDLPYLEHACAEAVWHPVVINQEPNACDGLLAVQAAERDWKGSAASRPQAAAV